MRKILTLVMLAMIATGVQAEEKKDSAKKNKPVFTVIKENPITTIKDQNRSGTCWDYSTLSFFEAEILKATGKKYTLCEAFVANKTYMERDSLNNFNEFFSVLEPYVAAVAKSNAKKLSSAWKTGMQGILDAYLGKCPEKFTYEGKEYTPKSFMASLGINLDDYVSITSYTHHPFYTAFAVEVQDNWRFPLSYNVPMDEMMQIIDNAVKNGYTVAWGGDVSEPGFTRQGLAYAIDDKKTQSLQGSDMAKWLKMTAAKKRDVIDSLGCTVPEIVPTQQMRQERFDNWELTDDHGMHIFGVAKDQNGKEYYMVQNSWGETGDYKGIWYMTKAFIAANTMDFLINKNAIPKEIRKKLGI